MKKLLLLVIGLAVLAAVVVAVLKLKPKPLIPSDIKKNVTSVIFVPSSPQVSTQKNTVKYDSNLKVLSYKATIDGVDSTISEQPTPDSFTDIPQVYAKVLESWKEYDQFEAASGTVYLTRPGDQNGKQVAVLNSKGTLLFIKAERDLSKDQWRQLFNSLQIQS